MGLVTKRAEAPNTVKNFAVKNEAYDSLCRNLYPLHLQFNLLAARYHSQVVLPEPGSMALFQESLQAPTIGFDTPMHRLMDYH